MIPENLSAGMGKRDREGKEAKSGCIDRWGTSVDNRIIFPPGTSENGCEVCRSIVPLKEEGAGV